MRLTYKIFKSDCLHVILIVLALTFSVFNFYYANLIFRFGSVAVGFLAFLNFLYCRKNLKFEIRFVIIFLCLMFFSILGSINSYGVSILIFFVFLSQVSISYLLVTCRIFNPVKYALILFLTLTYSLILFFDYGPEEFNVLMGGVGRNGYSALLFAVFVGYSVVEVSNKRKVSLILSLLLFGSMFPLYGRSSIVASAIIFAGVLTQYIKLRNLFIIFIPSALLFFYINDFSLAEYVSSSTNFKAGADSERWDVLEEWSKHISLASFFTGVDLYTIHKVVELDGNPHNSFIRMHTFFGVGLSIFIYYIIKSFFYLIKDNQLYLLFALVAILFKFTFDIIFFVGDVDFLLYPVLFYSIYRNLFNFHREMLPVNFNNLCLK